MRFPAQNALIPTPKSSITIRMPCSSEGAVMRRRAGGAGCGARALVSQTKVREAPGHRPRQLRGGALQWADGDRRKQGESQATPRWKVHPSGPESYGPEVQNRRRGAPQGARVPGRTRIRRSRKVEADIQGSADRRSTPSLRRGEEMEGRFRGASSSRTMMLGCLKIESENWQQAHGALGCEVIAPSCSARRFHRAASPVA